VVSDQSPQDDPEPDPDKETEIGRFNASPVLLAIPILRCNSLSEPHREKNNGSNYGPDVDKVKVVLRLKLFKFDSSC